MRVLVLILLIAITFEVVGQIELSLVDPISTDSNYASDEAPHFIVRNTASNNNRLFLFLGGTDSDPNSYFRIAEFAGNLGFDVISLSYPNTVPAASLSNVNNELVFDNFREEICYGTESSIFVTVNTLNSINSRIINLLNYLNTTFPAQNWVQYLINSTTIDWSKIAVAGHSQGAGHACYFGKFETTERVLMFSGPNDFSDFFNEPANWLGITGSTPLEKHFAYLSLLDEIIPFDKQLSNITNLGLFPLYDSLQVDVSNVPFDNSRCLYTTQNPGIALLHHNSPVRFSLKNNEVWEYMLTTDLISSSSDIDHQSTLSYYPNPTDSEIVFYNDGALFDGDYIVFNQLGQVILNKKMPKEYLVKIDLSNFKPSIYFVKISNEVFKIIRQ